MQWFDTKQQCVEMKLIHEDIPMDGDWKQVTYKCKPVGSKEADSTKINLELNHGKNVSD